MRAFCEMPVQSPTHVPNVPRRARSVDMSEKPRRNATARGARTSLGPTLAELLAPPISQQPHNPRRGSGLVGRARPTPIEACANARFTLRTNLHVKASTKLRRVWRGDA